MLTEINGFCLKLLNILYRQMMFPESIPLFLIVLVFSSSTDSNEPLIKVPETEQTKSEGSCVTISCTYDPGYKENLKLLWFKNPVFDEKEKCFIGTIVYSNRGDRPQSAGYSSRVEYITDKTENPTNSWMKCDLRINDLQKTDSGYYGFRIIGLDKHKYISTNMSLTVTDNPCKVKIDSSEIKYSVNESDEFTVRCSTSVSCSSHPEWILHKPGQEPERVTSSNNRFTQDKEENEGKKITRLKFNPTWEDDNMILSCRPEESQDSCLTRNITLSVEYVTLRIQGNNKVNEGDTLSLNCTVNSNPPSSNPVWSFNENTEKLKNHISAESLTITNVSKLHAGEYVCAVKYRNETLTKSININVIRVDNKSQNQSIQEFFKNLELSTILTFLAGMATLAVIFFVVLCCWMSCNRSKKTEVLAAPPDSVAHLETVQTNIDSAVTGEQTNEETPLQNQFALEMSSTQVEMTGPAEDSEAGGADGDVNYAAINYSLLKKKPEEEEEETANTDYAEIKRDTKGRKVPQNQDYQVELANEGSKNQKQNECEEELYSNSQAMKGLA